MTLWFIISIKIRKNFMMSTTMHLNQYSIRQHYDRQVLRIFFVTDHNIQVQRNCMKVFPLRAGRFRALT